MKVYFSHGKESGPRGFKIRRLSEIASRHGCDVESLDYSDQPDPDQRVGRLLAALANETDDIALVGSSMGGYVALVASASCAPRALFLMAPALYLEGFGQRQEYPSQCRHIEIVHGWSDDLIPADHSIRFAREADCTLHLISGDHPLNTSIEEVERLFEQFLLRALRDHDPAA